MIPNERLRSYRSYDVDAVSYENGLHCEDESKAVQSQRDESDINTIVRNFGLTGKMPTDVRVPSYGDFTGVDDYRSALDAIRAADSSFMRMPANVRARFENDPQQFLDFCMNPDNLEEMRTLGLAVPKVIEETVPLPGGGA